MFMSHETTPHFNTLADVALDVPADLKQAALQEIIAFYPDAPAALLQRGTAAHESSLDEIVTVDKASRSPFVSL